jgi:hypothetical protein
MPGRGADLGPLFLLIAPPWIDCGAIGSEIGSEDRKKDRIAMPGDVLAGILSDRFPCPVESFPVENPPKTKGKQKPGKSCQNLLIPSVTDADTLPRMGNMRVGDRKVNEMDGDLWKLEDAEMNGGRVSIRLPRDGKTPSRVIQGEVLEVIRHSDYKVTVVLREAGRVTVDTFCSVDLIG